MEGQFYQTKLKGYITQNQLFARLDKADRRVLSELAVKYHLSFQDFRLLVQAATDLLQWQAGSIRQWCEEFGGQHPETIGEVRAGRKALIEDFKRYYQALQNKEKSYTDFKAKRSTPKIPLPLLHSSPKSISGMCPVASPQTLCCRLRTVDAVETCPLGCSYCVIAGFYGEKPLFDHDFAAKLQAIPIDPSRYYHFGTGQSSDSLVWGNSYGVLDNLLEFARRNKNVLLELKTKTANIDYFLGGDLPPNLIISWSLNTSAIIEAEERYTAPLQARLEAARAVADRGIRVAFHFHPLILYHGWEDDYRDVVQRVLGLFAPHEVAFVSFGTLTFIKPAVNQIRLRGQPTKVLQMPLARDPKGKFTYPDDLKVLLFSTLSQEFQPWHNRVFFYLCMEKREIWKRVWERDYLDNESFEKDFCVRVGAKLGLTTPD